MQPKQRTSRWTAGALILMAALLLVACDGHHYDRHFTEPGDLVIGSGNLITESRSVGGFNGVTLSGVGRLHIEQAGSESLRITAEDNILPLLTSDVIGGRLELGTRDGFRISPTHDVFYDLTAIELNELVVSGAGEIDAVRLDTAFLSVTLSGAASVHLDGRADSQRVVISGAASYQAGALRSREVSITISGSGLAVVRASERLDVNVSGAAVVEYYGDPVVTVNGNGAVRRVGS